jgi:hypothetical protein
VEDREAPAVGGRGVSERYPGKRPSCAHRGACPMEDVCPNCRASVCAHDRAWLWMQSEAGLVASANYCGSECEEEAQVWPESIAEELRARKVEWSGLDA